MTRAKADPAVFGIKPEAVRAWLTLGVALRHMEDHGRVPVCASNPEDWSADAKPAVRAEAAEACAWCPAQPACLAFAVANAERFGVFGGRDFAAKPAKGKAA